MAIKKRQVIQVTKHIPRVVHFSKVDGKAVEMPYNDVLVVEAILHNFKVQKILVDDESKVKLRVFQAMMIPEENLVRDQTLVVIPGQTPAPKFPPSGGISVGIQNFSDVGIFQKGKIKVF